MSSTKVSSSWKDVNGVFIKVGGQWKTVAESWIKVGGQWKSTTFSTGPTDAPQMTHDGFGRFRVVNYDPSLIYEAIRVSGNQGSVSFNNGVFTLEATPSAYNVFSRFSANGPRSPAGYMERRRITFTFIERCVFNSRTCSREINEDYAATPIFGVHVGNQTDCRMYSCPGGNWIGPSASDGSNRCICTRLPDGAQVVVGGGQCPGGWFVCNGNRCCIGGQVVGYSCPNGGSLSGTTCIRRRTEFFDCSFWTSCNNEDPVPAGYNRSPGTANVQGEWWRTTR